MIKTHLIQRLKKPYPKVKGEKEDALQRLSNAFSFGGGLVNGGIPKEGMKLLRDIFRFDYMGSSEFEWGAVPEALAKIIDHRKDYVSGTLDFDKNPVKVVLYLCHKDHEFEAQIRIRQLADNERKFDLKERCNLKGSLEGREYDRDTCGWLELDNAFMFFTDEEMFDKTLELFAIGR